MEKSILDILVKKNEFPIIFVGSGISKRYLVEYPGWEELLEEFWKKTRNDNFFGYLNELKENILNQKTYSNENDDVSFEVNSEVASYIEIEFNKKFNAGEISIDGLTQKDAYKNELSPFKKSLSNRFSKYQIKESMKEELKIFGKMLLNSQMIITTNYDTFIEDRYNAISSDPIKKYIGQKGFFQQTTGYSELYKIHGCVTEPKSLIINQKDYKKYDKNSILISAKVISMLLHSPIIFIGYSLTDRNVRTMIKDFTSSLSDIEKIEFEKRILVIQWDDGNSKLDEEILLDQELGCRITVIKTDNYMQIYEKLSKINQGVAPSEVRRYQHVIKQLIIDRGKKGELKSVLVSPNELEDVEKHIGDKNIVVAIGDNKLIFSMPNLIEYIIDYLQESNEQNLDTMLRFIASQNNYILPFLKYVSEDNIQKCNLAKKEKEKLYSRLRIYTSLNQQLDLLIHKEFYNSLEEILSLKLDKNHEYICVAYNFDRIGISCVKQYILGEMMNLKKSGEISVPTPLRRLSLIYDFKLNC